MNPNKARKKAVKKASEQNVIAKKPVEAASSQGARAAKKTVTAKTAAKPKRVKQDLSIAKPTTRKKLALIGRKTTAKSSPAEPAKKGKSSVKAASAPKSLKTLKSVRQEHVGAATEKKAGRAVSDKSTGAEKKKTTSKTIPKKASGTSQGKTPKTASPKASVSGRQQAVAKTEKKTEKTAAGKPKETEKKEKPVKTSPKKTPSRSRTKTIEKDMKGAAAKVAALLKKPAREKTAADKKKKEAMMTEKPAAPKTSARKTAPEALTKIRKTSARQAPVAVKGPVTKTPVTGTEERPDTSPQDKKPDKKKESVKAEKKTTTKRYSQKTKVIAAKEPILPTAPIKETEKPETVVVREKPLPEKTGTGRPIQTAAVVKGGKQPVIRRKRKSETALPEAGTAVLSAAESAAPVGKIQMPSVLQERPEEKAASGDEGGMTDQYPEQPARSGLKIFLPRPDEPDMPGLSEVDHDVRPFWLPDEYGENSLFVVAIDPDTVFVDWEMVPQDIAGEEGDMILRFYDVTGDAERRNVFFDLRIDARIGNVFYPVLMPGCDVIVEAGVRSPRGEFKVIVRSGVVSFPALLKHDEMGIAQKLFESGIPVGY